MNFLKITSPNRTWTTILLWWEIRRIAYNLIMLVAGFLSLYIAAVSIPLVYVIIALALNAGYTIGSITEIVIIQNLSGDQVKLRFPKSFFLCYLGFSIFVVSLVALLISTPVPATA